MITVLGAGGFIGSALVNRLDQQQVPYYAPGRHESLTGKDLGDVIYCIGLTADFRTRPFDTIDAHVTVLNNLLREGNFSSLTYLSSTRVYIGAKGEEVNEDAAITIDINDSDELYTLSKLTGERICLSSGRNTKVVRLSNVFSSLGSSPTFLSQILGSVIREKAVRFFTTPDSAKDYIDLDTVTNALIELAGRDVKGIYNLGGGINITNQEIIDIITQYYETTVSFSDDAKRIVFPRIDNQRLAHIIGLNSSDIKNNLINSIKNFQL
jgi:nucleoside-diphosphate-sugar epimerase